MTAPQYSKFGEKFTQHSGITQLMQDLGRANQSNNPDVVMLGGGNPALIPAAHQVFVAELERLIHDQGVDQMLGYYDGPQGSERFIQVLVEMLNQAYDWGLSTDHIAITNGSQSSLFSLFNLFAGEMPGGGQKQVLLPLVPEYIGYADQGLSEQMFVSVKPAIKRLDNQEFKYQIDFEQLEQTLTEHDIGVICVSRPTNPSGNVITDAELAQLRQIAKAHQLPLIVDNAYGQPFPGVIYTQVQPHWDDNTILCLSLSKLGLPGLRTGVVIAKPKTIDALSRINGILALAPGGVGPGLLTRMIKDKELMPLVNRSIYPFYQDKAQTAIRLFAEIFAGQAVYRHKLEGAFFMWLWFPEMDMSAEDLYQALKRQEVYIIPGQDFFIGLNQDWAHQHQCIRINYAKDEATLRKGLMAIRQVVFSA